MKIVPWANSYVRGFRSPWGGSISWPAGCCCCCCCCCPGLFSGWFGSFSGFACLSSGLILFFLFLKKTKWQYKYIEDIQWLNNCYFRSENILISPILCFIKIEFSVITVSLVFRTCFFQILVLIFPQCKNNTM